MTAPALPAGAVENSGRSRERALFSPQIRAVLVLDDGVFVVRRDGSLEPVLAPGRPGGICAHATARCAP